MTEIIQVFTKRPRTTATRKAFYLLERFVTDNRVMYHEYNITRMLDQTMAIYHHYLDNSDIMLSGMPEIVVENGSKVTLLEEWKP